MKKNRKIKILAAPVSVRITRDCRIYTKHFVNIASNFGDNTDNTFFGGIAYGTTVDLKNVQQNNNNFN